MAGRGKRAGPAIGVKSGVAAADKTGRGHRSEMNATITAALPQACLVQKRGDAR